MTKAEKATIKDNRDGTVSFNYEPKEVGLHEIIVHHKSDHVQGIKFVIKIKEKVLSLKTKY